MDLWQLIEQLKQLSDIFYASGIEDVYTNSKIFNIFFHLSFYNFLNVSLA